MGILIVLSSLVVAIIFKDNLKKLIFIFLILFPYFGIFEVYLSKHTPIATIFYDFVFCIPIFLICYFKFHSRDNDPPFKNINFFIIFYCLFNFLYLLYPFNPYSTSLMAKLVGLKVWIFYVYFIYVGYYAMEDKKDFIKIINILSIGTIIPSFIVIMQYFIVYNFGVENVPFLSRSAIDPALGPKGINMFNIGGFTVIRLTGTFATPIELSNYLIFSLIPIITSFFINNPQTTNTINKIALFLIIIALILCGARSIFLFVPIFLLLYFYFTKEFKSFFIITLCTLVFLSSIYFFNIFSIADFLNDYQTLVASYSTVGREGFGGFVSQHFWGNGLGTATGANISSNIIPADYCGGACETYFFKIVFETGFFGLIVYLIFSIVLISYPYKVLTSNFDQGYKNFAGLVLSSFILNFYIFALKGYAVDLFPLSFFKYLVLGIVLRILYMKHTTKVVNNND